MSEISGIRAAIKCIRERAEQATPGPWRDSSTEDGIRFGALVADRRHPDRMQGGGWDWTEDYGGCLIGESHMSYDRTHIATWDPTTTAVIADLLEALLEERGTDVASHAALLAHRILR